LFNVPITGSCRLCSGELTPEPILVYPNSPASAQGFLDSVAEKQSGVELSIYQCASCGLVQHNLLPVNYYKDVIRAVAYSEEMAQFRLSQLSAWINEYKLKDKQIIEIGSGKGEYIDLLSKAGAHKVVGLEHSLESVRYAERNGINLKQGFLGDKQLEIGNEKFSAFVIFSFMEHWPDLNKTLRALHDLLLPNACGLVEVPNFEFILNQGMYSEFTVDHIYYFDRETLRIALEINGFKVQSIECVWHDYILSAKVVRRKQISVDIFKNKQTEIVKELHDYTNRYEKNDIVVWGAGHQALAIMSLAGLGDRVSHVVDSAPFKQNKYTPGTNLFIKSPATLKIDQPKSIIIIAAAYSDEVHRSVADQYPFIESIAVMRDDYLEVIK